MLNVLRTLPNENEYWRSSKVILAHKENIQTLEAISKHLKIEEHRMKVYVPPNMAFIAKGSGPKGNRPYHGKKPKKDPCSSLNSRSKCGFANKNKAKGNGGKRYGISEVL